MRSRNATAMSKTEYLRPSFRHTSTSPRFCPSFTPRRSAISGTRRNGSRLLFNLNPDDLCSDGLSCCDIAISLVQLGRFGEMKERNVRGYALPSLWAERRHELTGAQRRREWIVKWHVLLAFFSFLNGKDCYLEME